jgi:uncharacterized protein YjiK
MKSKSQILRRIVFIATAVIIIVFLYMIVFTGENWDEISISYANTGIPYSISSPDKTIVLPVSLSEVSGVSYYKDNSLVLVEDELGEVTVFNYKTEKVEGTYRFGKEADYEDIAVADDTVYVLKSNGDIYMIKWLGEAEQYDKKFNTMLSGRNDVEGLCYSKDRKSLLVICKGQDVQTSKNPEPGATKAIYGFDLILNAMLPEPVLNIDLNRIEDNALSTIIDKNLFQPSGIAVHPISGDMYIISSVGRLLLVLDRYGAIKSFVTLPRTMFRQPEGICFAPNADLFISNEARGAYATILVFKYLDQ